MMARIGAGTVDGNAGGSCWRIPALTSKPVAPVNGRRPATISYSNTPRAQMSLR